MKVLVINAGSSSLKYQLIDMDTQAVLAKGLCERIGIEGSCLKHTPSGKDSVTITEPMKDHSDAISMVINALIDKAHGVIADMKEIDAVGHRV
ncbi:MAG: acetate kinase, partial [Clostridia bacterium]|nr:acetate kinase [Clostridia bacterium]